MEDGRRRERGKKEGKRRRGGRMKGNKREGGREEKKRREDKGERIYVQTALSFTHIICMCV